EEKKVERIYKKLEEKVLREQAREKERLSRALRRLFEAEVSKRRTFARQTLQTRADAEGMAAILRDDACEGLECRTEEQQAAEDRDHDILQAALASARGTAPRGSGSSTKGASSSALPKAEAGASSTSGGGARLGGQVVLEELGLSQQQVANLLQLWDFLYCFREPLSEAGFNPARSPSLKRLAQALHAVDGVCRGEDKDGQDDDSSKRRRDAVALLSGMAAALAGLATPSAVKSLGMTNVEASDPLLIGPLHGPFAWAEMARTALSLHALREVGRDDKDLQPLLLGGGVNPVNNKDPKAMLTEADRKTVKLIRMRLEQRFEAAAARQGTSGPATPAAANIATVHTCPYSSAGALRTRVYTPGQAWCERGDWRFHLLSVTELDPYTPQDKAAIVRNLRAAVRLLDAATEGAPPNEKMKDQGGASASKNQQEPHSAAVAAAAAAAAAAESRHYFTLKAILDRSPERFPPPAGTAMMADEALL
ncbi:unnamed protein product, partial [Ectocarpus sp. 8 AP-2014]